MTLPPNHIVGNRYEIVDQLGYGGMAIVYKAKDLKLHRYVTVKVLRKEHAEKEEFYERFKVEALAVAALNHPNIVDVYDVGQDGSLNYIVMEYVNGITLKDVISKRAPLENFEIIGVAAQIAKALSHAHAHKIIHCDIKPQNIIVTADGTVKVMDFGIARYASGLTIKLGGETMGSVHYLSPEQAEGGIIDKTTDLYSLGIVMYEMATGKLPYEADSDVSVAVMHIKQKLPDMRRINPNISRSLEGIILKLTEKRSFQRYQNAGELELDLRAAMNNPNMRIASENFDMQGSTATYSADEIRKNAGVQKDIDMPDFSPDKDYDVYDENAENYDEYDEYYDEEEYEEFDDEDIGYDEYGRQLERSERAGGARGQKVPQNRNGQRDNLGKVGQKRNNNNTELKVILAAVASAVLLIAVVLMIVLPQLKKPVQELILVPDLHGLTLEEAESKTKSLNLGVKVLGEIYNDLYVSGQICDQNYTVGEDQGVLPETVIGVVLSRGSNKVNVVDVVGKDYVTATVELENAKFNVQMVDEYNDTVPKDSVISQEPLGNTEAVLGATVIIKVSRGSNLVNETVVIPNVTNMTEEMAKAKLEENGLELGLVSTNESDVYEKGLVIRQTPASGNKVEKGAKITIVISSGPPVLPSETPTPDATASPTPTPTESATPTPSEATPSEPASAEPSETASTEPTEEATAKPVSTKTIDIDKSLAGDSVEGSFNVTVILDGSTVYDKMHTAEDFPLSINVSGTGKKLYILDVNGNKYEDYLDFD